MSAFFSKKPVKITAIALGVVAVLAAAFFLAPGGQTPQSVTTSATATVAGEPAQAIPELNLPAIAGTLPAPRETTTTTAQHSTGASQSVVLPSTFTSSAFTRAASTTIATTIATAAATTQAGASTTKYAYSAAPTTATSSAPAKTTARPATTTATTTTTATVTAATKKASTVTISIRCDTILNNMDKLRQGRAQFVPSGGVIMAAKTVTLNAGDTAFTVLQRETRAAGIHMEFSSNPAFNSVYIEGVNNLYEFDCGELSGWMYKVNGWFPNYGSSSCTLKNGDVIEWVYTCDYGKDVGGDKAAQGV